MVVVGIPQPAGSKRAFSIKKGGVHIGKVAVTDSNPKSREWKTLVQVIAARYMRDKGLEMSDCPITLDLRFYYTRPKGHYNSKGLLTPSAPRRHTIKPDATKLLRGTEDALTGVVYRDDSQVCRLIVTKEYSDKPGVDIRVSKEL